MKVVHEHVFKNERVELDGQTWQFCEFQQCELVYRGGPMDLFDCHFKGCRYTLEGPAGNTLKFLADMYRSGGKAMIEQALEQA